MQNLICFDRIIRPFGISHHDVAAQSDIAEQNDDKIDQGPIGANRSGGIPGIAKADGD